MVMDDLKYNTRGPFRPEHQIFHASSNSYDSREEDTASAEGGKPWTNKSFKYGSYEGHLTEQESKRK